MSDINISLNHRLAALREEQNKGRQMLADQERECDELRATLLRIAGAIQVLEELMEGDAESDKHS